MKISRLQIIINVVFTLVALAIALPTVYFSINGEYKRIRGLDPKDLNPNAVVQEFNFQPAIDFSGGNASIINVDLTNVTKSQRRLTLASTRNILFTRLSKVGFSDFELNSLVNEDKEEFKLILKAPDLIDENLLTLLTRRGAVSVWITDPNPPEEKDPNAQQSVFDGRIQTGITNDDFSAVDVVSDSRIIFPNPNDPSTYIPYNYGLRVNYKEGSANKLSNAILGSSAGVPALYAIDGEPIAIQSPGQAFNQTRIGSEALLTTLGQDSHLFNSIVSSIMSTPALAVNLEVEQVESLSPVLGEHTFTNLKIAAVASFILAQGLILFYFRKNGLFAVASGVIFLIWSVAIMKMFNLSLSLSTYAGYMLALAAFYAFVVLILYRLRVREVDGLNKDEVKVVYEKTFRDYRNFTLAAVTVSLITQSISLLTLSQFSNGFGFGIIGGLLVFYVAIRMLLPVSFLRNR